MNIDNYDFYLYTISNFSKLIKSQKYIYILSEFLIDVPDKVEVRKFDKNDKLPYCDLTGEEYFAKLLNWKLTDLFKLHFHFIFQFIKCDNFNFYELSYDVREKINKNDSILYEIRNISFIDLAKNLLSNLIINLSSNSNKIILSSIKLRKSDFTN